ncbi:proline dehydrogenase family protein [Pedobacter sp. NJ-S-72]
MSSNFLTQVGPPVTNLFLNIGLPIQGIIKATIFKQFCGGETIAECEHTVALLADGKVGTILDYSVEGEDEEHVFDFTCAEIIRTIDRAAGDKRVPITVFKVTGIGRFALLEKMDAKAELSADEQKEFERVKHRCERICRTAFEKNVPVMIDAEETWIQDTIDALALDMMILFNKEKLIVYNTYQLYRHDKFCSFKGRPFGSCKSRIYSGY